MGHRAMEGAMGQGASFGSGSNRMIDGATDEGNVWRVQLTIAVQVQKKLITVSLPKYLLPP